MQVQHPQWLGGVEMKKIFLILFIGILVSSFAFAHTGQDTGHRSCPMHEQNEDEMGEMHNYMHNELTEEQHLSWRNQMRNMFWFWGWNK